MDATCRSDFKNGTFHLGDIQFQTIIAKSYKSPYQKIVLEEYKNWEEQCKDLKMELIDEAGAIAIFTRVKSEYFWKVASGGSFWLANKTPLIEG